MIQGSIIAYLRVPSFIVTLGGMFVLNGLILLVTQGKTIPANQPGFSYIAQGYLRQNRRLDIAAAIVILFLFWNMYHGRQRKLQHGFELPSLAIDLLVTTFLSCMWSPLCLTWSTSIRGCRFRCCCWRSRQVIMGYVANNTRFGRYCYAIGGNREAARLSGINIRRKRFFLSLC